MHIKQRAFLKLIFIYANVSATCIAAKAAGLIGNDLHIA